jgi:FAD/FMN-containing dehydrogenase
LPAEIHGKAVVGIAVCYVGDLALGEGLVRPLKEFGKPVVDLIGHKPYTAHQMMFDSGVPSGNHYYWKSEYLPSISDEAIDTVVTFCERLSSPLTLVLLFQLGGAISRVAVDATAAAHRDAAYVLNIATNWTDVENSAGHIEWTRNFWSAMQPYATGGVYVNFLSQDEGEARVKAAYGTNYERLVALKNKYDPANVFSLNQNIKPALSPSVKLQHNDTRSA